LATVAQVIASAGFDNVDEVGGTSQINEIIQEAETEVENDFGNPSRRSYFYIVDSNLNYEFRSDNKKTYRIDHLYIIDSDNTRTEYTEGTASETGKEFTYDEEFNKITFAQATITANSGNRVIVLYVPNAMHELVKLKAATAIKDSSTTTNSDEGTPAGTIRLLSRVKKLETAFATEQAVGSTNEILYDPTYGELIEQRRFRIY